MAALLQLVRGNDGLTTGSAFSLLDYTNDFNAAYGGWVPAVAGGTEPDLVSEAITLRLRSTHATAALSPVDDVSVGVQGLDEKLQQAEEYFDDEDELYGIWLQAQYEGESALRQALVRRGRTAPQGSFLSLAGRRGVIPEYILSLERFPWWESMYSTGRGTEGVNCLGGRETFAGPLATGDTNARIRYLSVTAYSLSGTLAEVWLGFRSNRYGMHTDLTTKWDLGNASVTRGDDTSRVSDATAYGGYKSQVSFTTTASLVMRTEATLSTFSGNPEAQRGTYTVLLRAKAATSTCCYARLLSGYTSGSDYDYRDRVKIDSTAWKLYDMGTVCIPPYKSTMSGLAVIYSGFALRIEAERTGGTVLDLDCLVLIPRSEGFAYIGSAAITGTYAARVEMSPHGRVTSAQFTSTDAQSVNISLAHFALPRGTCSVVAAGQTATQHYLTDSVAIYVAYIPRWRTLRGGA